MRTRSRFTTAHSLLGLAALAALAGCQPSPPGGGQSVTAEPAAEPEPPATDPVVLAKDPNVPLLILVSKNNSGVLCPTKVTAAVDSDCAQTPGSSHTACRKENDPVRWLVFNLDRLEFDTTDFTIEFADPNAPFKKQGSGPEKKCGTSSAGALDCKVKSISGAPPAFKYKVTMNGGESCPLDPHVYVNPRL